MPKNYAIVAKGLKKSYKKLEVLKGIDLRVEQGTILALLGPNGAGKTTTVKILSTLLAADDGQVTIHGYDLHKEPDGVRSVIGLTGQYAAVDEYLTGRENLEMMGRLYRLSQADAKRRSEELLQQFDLIDAAGRSVKTYSGGMRRRLDLAISLIAAPPIIFLDEPTTGLDPRSRIAMWEIIKQLVGAGATILLTTQYLDEADLLADKIAVIDGGKVIAEGTADELKQHVGNERLELTIAKGSNFQKAQKVVDGEALQVDSKRRLLSIAMTGGVKHLQEILNKLQAAGIEVDGLSLHKPTLDDVFLQLTGHQATKDDVAEEDKK